MVQQYNKAVEEYQKLTLQMKAKVKSKFKMVINRKNSPNIKIICY